MHLMCRRCRVQPWRPWRRAGALVRARRILSS